jgi:Flp pilus assembly protein TadD
LKRKPKEASPHHGLGIVYRILNRFEDALHAYLQAVQLEPENATIHCCLAAVYKKLNFLDEYHAHLAIAQKFIQNESTYNQACFEAVTGNPEAALALLGKALENKEINLDWAQQDPDFDAIRDDPRFQALLGKLETVQKEETGN